MSGVLYLYRCADPALRAAAADDRLEIARRQGLVDQFLAPMGGQSVWQVGLAPTFVGLVFTAKKPSVAGLALWVQHSSGLWKPANPANVPRKQRATSLELVEHWRSGWPHEASSGWMSHRAAYLGLTKVPEAQVTYFEHHTWAYMSCDRPLQKDGVEEIVTSAYTLAAEAASLAGTFVSNESRLSIKSPLGAFKW